MRRLFFLECSPYGFDSEGSAQVRKALLKVEANQGQIQVRKRSLVESPLDPITTAYASAITSRAPLEDIAFAQSERVIKEVEDCDAVLISTPMHNFTVPATLKLWIDYVLRANRTFTFNSEGKVGLLQDRPTFVLVRSGGAFIGDQARQPDFLTDYVRHALSIIGLRTVSFGYLPGPDLTAEVLDELQESLSSFLKQR